MLENDLILALLMLENVRKRFKIMLENVLEVLR